MEQPICMWRVPGSLKDEEPEDLADEICNALYDDDVDEFLRLINDPGFERIRDLFEADRIFRFDALKCAIAILEGKTKGIIDMEDVFTDKGYSPLHVAASVGSLALTKYFLERGDSVDVLSGVEHFNLKQATPIDVIVEALACTRHVRPWNVCKSVFELLVLTCKRYRYYLEVVRILVQNTRNPERVRQAFMDYAYKGQLAPLAVLFLAAPELFLSSCSVSRGGELSPFGMLYHEFNSLEKKTDIEEALSLLLDVFAMAGHKFVAYIRIEYPNKEDYIQSHLDIAFLLREVACNKLGVSSPGDYYLRFFKPVRPGADQLTCGDEVTSEEDYPGSSTISSILPFMLKRKDIDQAYINRVIPTLQTEDADLLNRAIEKKLSSMPTLHGLLEDITRVPEKEVKQEVKHPLQGFPFPSGWFPFPYGGIFEPSLRSFGTYVGSAKRRFDLKITPSNGLGNNVMKPTKLKSFLSGVKLSHIPIIAKRVFK